MFSKYSDDENDESLTVSKAVLIMGEKQETFKRIWMSAFNIFDYSSIVGR